MKTLMPFVELGNSSQDWSESLDISEGERGTGFGHRSRLMLGSPPCPIILAAEAKRNPFISVLAVRSFLGNNLSNSFALSGKIC